MENGRSNLVDVDFSIIKIDDPKYKGVLFRIDGKEVWLPRSLIEIDQADKTVAMPEWLAMEKGLI